MAQKKIKALVCPLNWGLGHASRMILVIQELLIQNIEVIIAADKTPLQLLQKEFPKLKSFVLKDIEIKYSRKNQQLFKIIRFLPQLAFRIIKENRDLSKIIAHENINLIISDNRYGLWNKQAYSIFVTHQLRLKLPKKLQGFEFITQRIIQFLTRKFDEIWIPDLEGQDNFSGTLSHLQNNQNKKIQFVGILSKFLLPEFQANNYESNEKKNILAILSGPEPQRTIFEDLLIKQINQYNLKASIVLGKKNTTKLKYENIEIIEIADRNTLYKLINEAEIIICRAGYSSIMDLVALGKSAILVATPGQTEQEYLSDFLSKKKLFTKADQSTFDLRKSIFELKNNNSKFATINNLLLSNAIKNAILKYEKSQNQVV